MLAYMFLLAAATPDKPRENDALPATDAGYRCIDGTIAKKRESCPAVAYPDAPFPATRAPEPMPMPRLTRGRPARPRNNPGLWANTNDYPSAALRDQREGIVGFRLTVGSNGVVSGCQITSSSGWPDLDAATCSNISRRARFEPALDADGNPTIGAYSNRVTWKIPAEPSYAVQVNFSPNGPQAVFGISREMEDHEYPVEALRTGQQGTTKVELDIAVDGRVNGCTVLDGSGSEILDAQSCAIAKQWVFLPSRDADGAPVAGKAGYWFRWTLPDAWRPLNSPTYMK